MKASPCSFFSPLLNASINPNSIYEDDRKMMKQLRRSSVRTVVIVHFDSLKHNCSPLCFHRENLCVVAFAISCEISESGMARDRKTLYRGNVVSLSMEARVKRARLGIMAGVKSEAEKSRSNGITSETFV